VLKHISHHTFPFLQEWVIGILKLLSPAHSPSPTSKIRKSRLHAQLCSWEQSPGLLSRTAGIYLNWNSTGVRGLPTTTLWQQSDQIYCQEWGSWSPEINRPTEPFFPTEIICMGFPRSRSCFQLCLKNSSWPRKLETHTHTHTHTHTLKAWVYQRQPKLSRKHDSGKPAAKTGWPQNYELKTFLFFLKCSLSHVFHHSTENQTKTP
jgi:hypothetical protein